MKLVRKGLSSLLIFALIFSTVFGNMLLTSVSAAEAQPGETYEIDFRKLSAENLGTDGTNKTYSDDKFTYVGTGGIHGAQYGLDVKKDAYVEFPVAGDAIISVMVSKYATENSKFTVSVDGSEVGSIPGRPEPENAADPAENTYEYKGKAGTVRLTFDSAQGYLAYVKVQNMAARTAYAEVWDFGGVDESNDVYTDNITVQDLKNTFTGLTAKGTLGGSTYTFGDVSYVPNSGGGDRIYVNAPEASDLTYQSGWGSSKHDFGDGYTADGCIYANGAGGENRRCITIDNCKAGDLITAYMGNVGSGEASVVFTNGTQKDETGKIANSGFAKLAYVCESAGTYKIYTVAASEKSLFYRITRASAVTVSGTVEDSVGANVTEITFTNNTTDKSASAAVKNNSYSIDLQPGYTYTASISNVGFAVNNTNNTVEVPLSADAYANGVKYNTDIIVQDLVEISGKCDPVYGVTAIKFVPTDTTLATITADYNKSEGTYKAKVVKGKEYTINVEGATKYDFVPVKGSYENNATVDITMTAKAANAVTGSFYELKAFPEKTPVTSGITGITFTDEYGNVTNGEVTGGTYSANVIDGKYTITLTGAYDTYSHVDVSGKAAVKDVYVEELSDWSFSGIAESGTSISEYKGLTFTNAKAHNNQYIYIGSGGSAVIPVSGKKTVTISSGFGFNASITDNAGNDYGTVSDSSNSYSKTIITNDNTTSVTVNVTGTTYLTGIKISDAVDTSVRTLQVGADKTYKTINDALAAAEAVNSAKAATDSDRIVIEVDPGTYKEQIKISVPYITLKKAEGTSGEVLVTWYYGIDYSYYSLDSAGFYSKKLAADQYAKTTCVNNWGSTLYVGADGFIAEDITFENSFNRYFTEEEFIDGVETGNTANNAKLDRMQYKDNYAANAAVARQKSGTKTENAIERAAALAVRGADNTEYYNCKFLSSQDTVYTGNNGSNTYFKNCYIEGMTDYIFGDEGNRSLFENCDLAWAGYTKNGSVGYLTATRSNYLFKNCNIIDAEADYDVIQTTGYFGRPWGATANVIYVNTTISGAGILEDGWTSMSGVEPTSASFRHYASKKAEGDGFVSFTTTKANYDDLTDGNYNNISDDTYLSGWTPKHYVPSIGGYKGAVNISTDEGKAILVYGEVNGDDLDKASEIGFEISGKDNLFGKTSLTDGNVYTAINYKDSSGKDHTLNPSSAESYLYACLLTAVDGKSFDNLYIREVAKSGTEDIYGKTNVITNSDIASAAEAEGESETESAADAAAQEADID